MAGKLDDVAKWRGENEFHIVPMVNRYGQAEAAKRLGVTQAGLSKWLKANGYVARTSWMKGTPPDVKASIQAAADRNKAWRKEQGLPDED